MAVTATRVSVTTSATLLYAHPRTAESEAGDHTAKHVSLINASASPATVILGPSGVTTGNGARWIVGAGVTLSLDLEVGESIYGIVASGTQDIDVLVNGR
jgi:hypothetical protein